MTYEIRAVGDFLAVPAERLPYCLAEFAAMLTLARAAQSMLPVDSGLTVFRWTDDDAPGLTEVRITTRKGKL